MSFEGIVLEYASALDRSYRTKPLYLGGIAGSGGGIGTPPGGIVGYLNQTNVSYDLSELSYSGLPASGYSILDNLNHIRYRITELENDTVAISVSFETYDPNPTRSDESDEHGGLQILATAQPLDSSPTDIVVTKGTGKVVISIIAGSDLEGDITITGTSVDRNTGTTSAADTDTITISGITTDASDTDSNGNTRYSISNGYISSKWFVGTVTLSTTDLTLTDVDVYHVSFEQFNDSPGIVIDTFDQNIFTTNVNAEFDSYLYALEVSGSTCAISIVASVNVGTGGETAIADKYWRLRRGNIGKSLDGTTDGVWVTTHYSNSPAYVEDVSMKVWATKTVII